MPTKTHTPGQAAQALGVTAQSIRRYCSRFFAHLDPEAAPAKGRPRLLSDADLYKLRQINEWTRAGKTYEEIDALLDGLTVPEATIIHQEAPTTGLEALAAALLAQSGRDDKINALAARVERQGEELAHLITEVESKRARIDVVFVAAAAFIAGLLAGLSAWWFR